MASGSWLMTQSSFLPNPVWGGSISQAGGGGERVGGWGGGNIGQKGGAAFVEGAGCLRKLAASKKLFLAWLDITCVMIPEHPPPLSSPYVTSWGGEGGARIKKKDGAFGLSYGMS